MEKWDQLYLNNMSSVNYTHLNEQNFRAYKFRFKKPIKNKALSYISRLACVIHSKSWNYTLKFEVSQPAMREALGNIIFTWRWWRCYLRNARNRIDARCGKASAWNSRGGLPSQSGRVSPSQYHRGSTTGHVQIYLANWVGSLANPAIGGPLISLCMAISHRIGYTLFLLLSIFSFFFLIFSLNTRLHLCLKLHTDGTFTCQKCLVEHDMILLKGRLVFGSGYTLQLPVVSRSRLLQPDLPPPVHLIDVRWELLERNTFHCEIAYIINITEDCNNRVSRHAFNLSKLPISDLMVTNVIWFGTAKWWMIARFFEFSVLEFIVCCFDFCKGTFVYCHRK